MLNIKLRLLLAAAFSVIALAGCASQQDTPQLSSGVLLDDRDTSVRPQDDFFHYVNGGWIARNEIPADKSSYGSFRRLAENAEADVRVIVEKAAANNAEPGGAIAMVGTLYNSFMAEERVNDAGVSPLEVDLAYIDSLADKDELMAGFARESYMGVKSPLAISIREDYNDPTRYRAYLLQSGLGLPNSDYYADDSDKGQEIVAAYNAYMRDIYRALGYDEPAASAAAQSSWLLEAALASHHRPPEENREYARWYNLYGKGEKTRPPGVGWEAYLAAFQLDDDAVISLSQPEYFQGFAEVLAETPLDVWQDYMKLRVASSSAPYLDQHMQDLSFNFYSKTLYGVPEMPPRWKRGVDFVNSTVGEAIGQIYVQEHFPPEAKLRMDELVGNLILAYRESIESLDWMSAETRANALVKLEKFTPNIGYPNKWKDYREMEVGAELLANVRAAVRWEMDQDVEKLDKPVDKNEWFMTPQTVNAYYYSLQNAITFPAAILQPPFFDIDADDAVNYGAIGAVIGHEIGHGFDDNGSQFDGDGRLHNWWTSADHAAFKERAAMLVEQYDHFEVLPGVPVNGTLTQGENIGDLAGVSIAYKAYLKSLAGEAAPVMDGYTGEQRFFIGFAQAFQHKAREEQARQQVKTDTHSPALFRVNGTLSNVDGFYKAFDVRSGDALYRAPQARVVIW